MENRVCILFLTFFHLLFDGTMQAHSQESERSLSIDMVYSAMPWYNASGGIKTGFVYLDNADITAKLELDQILGMPSDFSLFVYGLGNHGGKATDLMGDFQVASNIEAAPSWKLFELWMQKNFFDDGISILTGLYDLNSEFDVLKPGTLFIHSSFGIGAEFAQSGENSPSIFPVSSLGIRFSSRLGERFRLRAAVLDGVPGDPSNPGSNRISISRSQGALIATELSIYERKSFQQNQKSLEREYETRRRKVGRQGSILRRDKINVGAWIYTSEFQLITDDATSRKGNRGAYIGAQKYFPLNDKDDFLSLFARAGIANDAFNRYGAALSGGVVIDNPFTKMADEVGLAVSSGLNGNSFMRFQEGEEKTETALELTYSIPIFDWLLIQPDLQYVVNPSTRKELSNAFAFAILAQLSHSF